MAGPDDDKNKNKGSIVVIDNKDDDDKNKGIGDDVDDDELSMDAEQLEEYKEMIEELGSFPDKVIINTLSMIADDYADSVAGAKSIYDMIRKRLLDTHRDNVLPLVYVVDSILKNVKGKYVDLVQDDAAKWIPAIYHPMLQPQRAKLEKVWRTWNEFQIFETSKWKEMGACFETNKGIASGGTAATTTANGAVGPSATGALPPVVAGIRRTKDGSLLLSASLRKEMQSILDDLQSGVNEIEKVSLERLAIINPDLLSQIKQTATASSGGGGNNNNQAMSQRPSAANSQEQHDNSLPSFFTETRSPGTLQQAHAWKELFDGAGKNSNNKSGGGGSNQWDAAERSRTVCSFLRTAVQKVASDEDARYTQDDALSTVQYLAAASATASLVEAALERLQDQQKKGQRQQQEQERQQQQQQLPNKNPGASHHPHGMMMLPSTVGAGRGGGAVAAFAVNTADFTNDGIKPKNAAVIGLLYQVGLPFVSSADGQRFATQLELSNHLDALFQQSQLEKSMARTEERGWFVPDLVWEGLERDGDDGAERQQDDEAGTDKMDSNNDNNATAMTDQQEEEESMPADETRERCVICGINFKMFFHNDDGMYKYKNCREIAMIHDDDAGVEHEESEEQVLVHVTCWKGLGSPEVLTAEQALQYT